MSVVDRHLTESREQVERFLDARLPRASEPPESLHEAMRYAVFAGGKRLRPALALGAARACGGAPDTALPAAAAVELVHAYSLVHDDLPAMDDDTERRGQPTVHVKFGEATAILAGDALLAEAFVCLAAAAPPADVVARLAEACGSRQLVGGQVDDLAFARSPELHPDADALTGIHARKTGALFRFACFAGARLAGAAPDACAALERFGAEYGLAFQLADDLDDAEPGECSALRVWSADEVRQRTRAHVAGAIGALEGFGKSASALRGVAERLLEQLA